MEGTGGVTVTASDLTKMLADRHAKDVFVPECKDGASLTRSHSRLDAWAMERSWSHPCTYGYEIKVSRQDFVGDTKWRAYLQYCNQFYFVAPKGVIEPSELPSEAGLLVAAGAHRLLTKKKAPHRDVAIPENFYRYILMCRSKIVSPNYYETKSNHEYWQDWLKERQTGKELGYQVSRAVCEHVARVEAKNLELKRRMESYDQIRRTLKAMGLNEEYCQTWTFERRAKELKQAIPADFLAMLDDLSHDVVKLRDHLVKLNTQQPQTIAP